MDGVLIAAWMSATGTVLAVWYARRSAAEAARAAKAAADQVELQRPRPIVMATFSCSLSPNNPSAGTASRSFLLENIGNSPAFDVEVGMLETPGPLPDVQGRTSRMTTSRLPFLLASARPIACEHELEPQRGAVRAFGQATVFAEDAGNVFTELARGKRLENDCRCEIPFELKYRALDGRQFTNAYRFVVSLSLLRAWIEPAGSLLETAGEDGLR